MSSQNTMFYINGILPFAWIPQFKGKDTSPTFHDCSNGYFMVYNKETSVSEYADYCELLVKLGYVCNFQNQICEDKFGLYQQKDGKTIYVYHIEHSQELRIIATENPPTQLNKQEYQRICKPFICQINTGKSTGSNEGMGYIIRLCDGSFLIIDGGYPDDFCSEDIERILTENAANKECIKVAAWIFTHGHIDHAGAFLKFSEKHSSDQTFIIEHLIFNFCLSEEQCKYTDEWFSKRVLKCINTYYRDTPVFTPFTGQQYQFSNAKIEILFTMEDFMPNVIKNESDAVTPQMKKGDGNNQSVVLRIKIDGKSFFVMGDTTKICCDEMCLRYRTYLKSDYVQMAHHGLSYDKPRARNATVEIYDYISPAYAFLPCSAERYPVRIKYEVNQYLNERVKEVIVAGEGERILYLE